MKIVPYSRKKIETKMAARRQENTLGGFAHGKAPDAVRETAERAIVMRQIKMRSRG